MSNTNKNFWVWYKDENNTIQRYKPNPDLTPEKAIELIVPEDCEFCIIPDEEYVMKFASAYEIIEKTAVINIQKSQDILIEKFRAERTPILQKLDLEYMRADESGNLEHKKEIAEKKQVLRDITKIELPNNIKELKNFWPEILNHF
jgi:hypothetical protein